MFSYDQSVSDYLDMLKSKRKSILDSKDKLVDQIKSYVPKYVDLQFAYEYFNSNVLKGQVSQKFLESNSVLICEGYVEEKNVDDLKSCLKNAVGSDFCLEINEVDLEDSADVSLGQYLLRLKE